MNEPIAGDSLSLLSPKCFAQRKKLLLLILAVAFAGHNACVAQNLDPVSGAPAFDEAAVDWRADTPRLRAGLVAAEAFRKRLISRNADGVGRLIEGFRRQAMPPAGRPDLANFSVTTNRFTAQLQGAEALDAREAFTPFAGRWYGEWDKLRVDHHWGEVFVAQSLQQPAKQIGLAGRIEVQDAWIGDGFGWNLLVQPAATPGRTILGYVYHVEPYQPHAIRFEFPLVGYLDGPGRLIWVTPTTVFFEEVIFEEVIGDESLDKSRPAQRYAITGFNYAGLNHAETGCRVTPTGRAFQAVYTRTPEDRPPWLQFDMPSLEP